MGGESGGLVEHAKAVLSKNRYLTLGTSGIDGRPWTTPVYFAAAGVRDFYWISEVEARHSRHLARRPDASLVVFDSTVAPYQGRAVYASGSACALSDDEIDDGLVVYPRPGDPGVEPLTRGDVTASSSYRLFRLTASEVWVLCPRQPREPCALHARAGDHRVRVV
jgi:nitroimidazol reductase NimA-like FMN-containing flavoprotein (pyridoxamine 5'-phosphate oxidase superfamily)